MSGKTMAWLGPEGNRFVSRANVERGQYQKPIAYCGVAQSVPWKRKEGCMGAAKRFLAGARQAGKALHTEYRYPHRLGNKYYQAS